MRLRNKSVGRSQDEAADKNRFTCRLPMSESLFLSTTRLCTTRFWRMGKTLRLIAWKLALVVIPAMHQCAADSALPSLSGFDESRIDASYPPQDMESLGELAKLIYRLRPVSPAVLESKASTSPTNGFALGDATRIAGVIEESSLLAIPERLVEFLEFSKLQVIRLTQDDGTSLVVVSLPLPPNAKLGDQVSGTGIVIELDTTDGKTSAKAVACSRLGWFPKASSTIGWQLLRQSGVDISLLPELGARNRRPLMSEDSDAFYSMLAAAARLQDDVEKPSPATILPVTLLKGSSELAGQWIRMNLETVQVTRIAITDLKRQAELGSDHYFQIDAVGDLGNVVVRIERADGDDGPPATFNNRYPVSLVIRDLPEFLSDRIRDQEGSDAIVSRIRMQVRVDGFFFRLWSYSTDFMNQHGGGEQFGPLLIASEIHSRESTSNDPVGVGMIGTLAAIAVILGILGVWFWHRQVEARDRAVRERRKNRESEQWQMP